MKGTTYTPVSLGKPGKLGSRISAFSQPQDTRSASQPVNAGNKLTWAERQALNRKQAEEEDARSRAAINNAPIFKTPLTASSTRPTVSGTVAPQRGPVDDDFDVPSPPRQPQRVVDDVPPPSPPPPPPQMAGAAPGAESSSMRQKIEALDLTSNEADATASGVSLRAVVAYEYEKVRMDVSAYGRQLYFVCASITDQGVRHGHMSYRLKTMRWI